MYRRGSRIVSTTNAAAHLERGVAFAAVRELREALGR
jgi:hypothetical protein